MCSVVSTVNTNHEDIIHDAQLDYYGARLATCSSDKSIKIFDVLNNQQLIGDLSGHDGPVWQVAWSHPMFGSLLASCSYDKKIIVWKESENYVWERIYEYCGHSSSVNSVIWAPHEYGLMLAAGSSDGVLSIHSYANDTWDCKRINQAHGIGCNAVSWAPATTGASLMRPGSEGAAKAPPKRLVSGGCDNFVKIWREVDGKWELERQLDGHTDWVRDVAWAPAFGTEPAVIASCSQDKTVIVWRATADGNEWTQQRLNTFDDVVWHVSWSLVGNVLAVSGADNKVTLWKEDADGSYKLISDVSRTQTDPARK